MNTAAIDETRDTSKNTADPSCSNIKLSINHRTLSKTEATFMISILTKEMLDGIWRVTLREEGAPILHAILTAVKDKTRVITCNIERANSPL